MLGTYKKTTRVCVRLTGKLLPIIQKLFQRTVKFFENFCNTSLTNLHSDCFLPFAQKFNVQAKKNPTDAPFCFLCEVLVYTIDHLISVPPLNLKTICSLEYIVIVSITAFQSPVSKSVIKCSCFSNQSFLYHKISLFSIHKKSRTFHPQFL